MSDVDEWVLSHEQCCKVTVERATSSTVRDENVKSTNALTSAARSSGTRHCASFRARGSNLAELSVSRERELIHNGRVLGSSLDTSESEWLSGREAASSSNTFVICMIDLRYIFGFLATKLKLVLNLAEIGPEMMGLVDDMVVADERVYQWYIHGTTAGNDVKEMNGGCQNEWTKK
ncbi:hypothetical protein BDV98DRAFT_586980 [Pterulicium gracile]|uniref:Uncharacterized protein n=1 Tax=Pterulicium gracile TaxID=1884261 RepID=A0A5C3Q364_9AGAR|nr:hypothetical protein BDV98DRAFT_586980 [Pterula gracilis]